jgi:hypothetical protein
MSKAQLKAKLTSEVRYFPIKEFQQLISNQFNFSQ